MAKIQVDKFIRRPRMMMMMPIMMVYGCAGGVKNTSRYNGDQSFIHLFIQCLQTG